MTYSIRYGHADTAIDPVPGTPHQTSGAFQFSSILNVMLSTGFNC